MHSTYYQYFVGRDSSASLLKHSGAVFKRMSRLDWQQLARIGVDWVYLLGVFDTRGSVLVTHENDIKLDETLPRTPSVFAISNHAAVHPDLGTTSDFCALVDRLHASGMKVMVDFVANHTGTTHPWIAKHPDWYHHTELGRVSEFSGDVVKLNYQNKALRAEMIRITQYILSWGVDGFRCDMAHLVPDDFWSDLISGIHRVRPVTFVAEAYTDSVFDWQPLVKMHDSGFDLVYNEIYFRTVDKVLTGEINLKGLAEYINYFVHREDRTKWLTYAMNHDDCIDQIHHEYVDAMTMVSGLLGSAQLLFNGQLNGLSHRLAHHWVETLPASNYEISQKPTWYAEFYRLANQKKWLIVDAATTADNLLICQLQNGTNNPRLIVNFNQASQAFAHLVHEIEFAHKTHQSTLLPGGVVVGKSLRARDRNT
jgi:hypothetical protein